MNCYVNNPNSGAPIPHELNKDNTLFYPESGMTTHDLLHTDRPRDYHIITDSHFLVPLYSKHEVFIFDGKQWVNPDYQTYGTSYNLILNWIFKYKHTIPRAVIDGKTTNCMGSYN